MKYLINIKNYLFYFSVFSAVFFIDFITKELIIELIFLPPKQIKIFDFLNLSPVWNPGISFGIFSDKVWIGKKIIPFVALVVIVWMIFNINLMSRLQQISAGLISGGATGNVIDRFKFGSVVDFIDFHINNWHWPAFNFADSAIFTGAVLWIYCIFRDENKGEFN